MKTTRESSNSTPLLSLLFLLGASLAFGQQAPNIIVPCGTTGQVTYSGELDFVVPSGQTAVQVASNIIAAAIASEWGCGVCGEDPPFWSCNKGGTGSADPADFSGSVYQIGGVWYVSGTYNGSIDVTCRSC
jgi:hypothetical protein